MKKRDRLPLFLFALWTLSLNVICNIQAIKSDESILEESESKESKESELLVAIKETPLTTNFAPAEKSEESMNWKSAVAERQDVVRRQDVARPTIQEKEKQIQMATTKRPKDYLLEVQSTSSTSYNLKDLEIVANEKNFHEFFSHRNDIRPSLRGEEWNNLVEQMGEAYSASLLKKRPYLKETLLQINDLGRTPSLKSNSIFLRNRALLILNYFKQQAHLEKIESLLESTLPLWTEFSVPIDLNFQMAQFLNNSYPDLPFKQLLPYLKPIFENEDNKLFCSKDFLKNKLLKYVYNISENEESDKKFLQIVKSTVSESCLKELAPILKTILLDLSLPLSELVTSFRLLKGLYLLNTLEEELFLTSYLLLAPPNGELLNRSWQFYNEVAKYPSRRTSLLKEMTKWERLPDQTFKLINEKRKSVLTHHLEKNFPEYLDFYAKFCIDYLKRGNFLTTINPTPSCKEFFATYQSGLWPSPLYKGIYLTLTQKKPPLK